MHRPKMNWNAAKKRHKKGTVEQKLFSSLQKLISIRSNTPEWSDLNNCSLSYCENKHVLAYLRWNDLGRKTLVLANFHDSQQFVRKDILFRHGFDMIAGVVDKFSGKEPHYNDELIVFKPYQFFWITDKIYHVPAGGSKDKST